VRSLVIIWLIFALPFSVLSQTQESGASFAGKSKADTYLMTFLQASQADTHDLQSFREYVQRLEKKTHKNQSLFLRYLFTSAHQKFLKQYTEYSSFGELFETGTYNCLTGTIFYALLLEQYGISYQIIETNYHIFLIAKTDAGDVLFEATDPVHGFVSNPEEVNRRISIYKKNSLQTAGSEKKMCYRYTTSIYNAISLDEMVGLTYYNMAVNAYNKEELQDAIGYLSKATTLYSSSRTEEFLQILLLTIKERDLDSDEKAACLKKVQSISTRKVRVVASENSF